MNSGDATNKMINLLGEGTVALGLVYYQTVENIISGKSPVDSVLTEFRKIAKSLHALQKRGHLTDEGELTVYASLLWNLGIYDNPTLLLDLILRVSSGIKPGPKPSLALDTLISWLRGIYELNEGNAFFPDESNVRKESFWNILYELLHEMDIKYKDSTSPETMKTHWYRYRDEYSSSETHQLIQNVLWDVAHLKDYPTHERTEKFAKWISPRIIRAFLLSSNKK